MKSNCKYRTRVGRKRTMVPGCHIDCLRTTKVLHFLRLEAYLNKYANSDVTDCPVLWMCTFLLYVLEDTYNGASVSSPKNKNLVHLQNTNWDIFNEIWEVSVNKSLNFHYVKQLYLFIRRELKCLIHMNLFNKCLYDLFRSFKFWLPGLSMEGQKRCRFHQKCLNLCFKDKRRS